MRCVAVFTQKHTYTFKCTYHWLTKTDLHGEAVKIVEFGKIGKRKSVLGSTGCSGSLQGLRLKDSQPYGDGRFVQG
jgi:hypothetical protein